MSRPYSLVADVGGTNTRAALASGGKFDEKSIRRYANSEHGSLGSVLKTFLDEMGSSDAVGSAAIAVAGPVRDGTGEMTNLDWHFSNQHLMQELGLDDVHLLNDLQALGYGLDHLPNDATTPVLTGKAGSGNRLVVGIGTGFNSAVAVPTSLGTIVCASESGHASLPARGVEDHALVQWLESTKGFASVEDVVSGRGLAALYSWDQLPGEPRPVTGADVIAGLSDPTDPRAEAAMRIFVRMTATVIGDLALATLPFGGIYLAGGVARAIGPWLDKFGFAAGFGDKGRFSDFVADFPVSIIQDDYAALTGCAAFETNPEKI